MDALTPERRAAILERARQFRRLMDEAPPRLEMWYEGQIDGLVYVTNELGMHDLAEELGAIKQS